MDKITPQPIYLQFKNILLEKISSGVYPVGSCLPSERILEDTYHISRVSVRKTLEMLTEEGYIEKSVGRRSIIRRTGTKTGRRLAFASNRSRSAILDVYGMYFESLMMKCSLRGDNLYYLDFGAPLPDVVHDMHFEAVFSTSNSEALLKDISALPGHPPIISLDSVSNSTTGRTVSTDNRKGGCMAADFLLSRGHRNLLFLGVESAYDNYRPFSERKEGFLSAIKKSRAECQVLDIPDALPETVEFFLAKQLKKKTPDVIFAFNDRLAITILKILYSKRLHVPDDISVMGFDGLEVGKYLSPTLTTIVQPVLKITETAFDWLERGAFTGENMRIAPTVLEMESVGWKTIQKERMA